MTKNENDINSLINKTIDASIEFEGIIDSIDFNSYLPEEQEDEKVKKSSKYKSYYKDKIDNALASLNVEENKQSNPNDEYKFIKKLIDKLFNAKKIRLDGRQQVEWKEETKRYDECTCLLHSNLDSIHLQEEKFNDIRKDNEITDRFNIIRVLYYNELAICYSGFKKSSMSLGYAEESIDLLEKLYPGLKNFEKLTGDILNRGLADSKKVIENQSHIIGLYTFALINKGEAKRTLEEVNSAFKTFQIIVNIYKKCKDKIDINSSDYYYALLRKALILIDQGRGQEAIICLESKELENLDPLIDYRAQQRDLEKASALIDQKEYKKAWKLLANYTKRDDGDFENSFTQRQAKIYQLRLMNEFRKNRPVDFQALKDNNIYPNREDYSNFEETAKELIKEAGKRKDGDSFKGACTKLAEFYQLENAEKQKKDFDKALIYFHLYLFESKMFSYNTTDINDIIQIWLKNNVLDSLLQDYKDAENFFPKNLINNDDENYLRDFFDAYIDQYMTNDDTFKVPKDQLETITKLKERLDIIYQQKDKDIASEQISIKFERFMENLKKNKVAKREKFIENYFFKKTPVGMRGESIVSQMVRNTTEFIAKIVGTSKILVESKDEIQGTLSVLRRWNSFTPMLSSSINKSKGGGYFLRFSYNYKSLGIVIDPGYNFLENFFSQGFKIGDIDLVLVSHAHPDHTDDLSAILSLFHEMNGRLGEYPHKKKANKKNPILVLSSGVFEHYNHIISSSEKELKDIIVVEGKDEIKLVYTGMLSNKHEITIKAFGTTHQDLSQFQSLGFIITAKKNDEPKAVIGYTGDIKWRPNKTKPPGYLKYFNECDIICVHLGSIINILKGKDFCSTFCKKFPKSSNNDRCPMDDKCKEDNYKQVNVTKSKLIEQTREENHLYLAGLTLFFNSLLKEKDNKLKLAIISEFGEELKSGIRMDLYKKFDSWFKEKSKEKPKCLPGDIGLEVDVFTGNVYCHCCKRFVDRAEIEPVPYGKEEAICFVCKECKAVLSSYQIDHILKEYCENGCKLELAELNTSGGYFENMYD